MSSYIFHSTGLAADFQWLLALLIAPFFFGLLVGLYPKDDKKAFKALAIAGVVVIDVLALFVLFLFKPGVGAYQMVISHTWISLYGISLTLAIDGISLFLVMLVAFVFTILLTAQDTYRHSKSYIVWLFLLEGACFGSFLSIDLFSFFVFFEFTLVPAYFLVARYGEKQGARAAMYFFLYTLLGSAFFLVGIIVLVIIHKNQTGSISFSLLSLANTKLSLTDQILLVLAFNAAFFVKIPVFPFHTWSPVTYREAPLAGSVALASIMAKLGTYGLIRFDLALFPEGVRKLAWLFLTFGVVSILYGAVVACVQKDLKRLVAYSSISHLGFVVLGVFALTSESLSGGVYEMVAHGIITAGLFLGIAQVALRRKTFNLDNLRGLQKPAPVLAGFFLVFVLAGLGLPGLGGFVGEFLVLIGTFAIHRWWAISAVVVVVISATYFLWAYQRGFHLSADQKNASIKDLSIAERLSVIPLALAIIAIGVFPNFMLSRITPSVALLLKHYYPSSASAHTYNSSSQLPANYKLHHRIGDK